MSSFRFPKKVLCFRVGIRVKVSGNKFSAKCTRFVINKTAINFQIPKLIILFFLQIRNLSRQETYYMTLGVGRWPNRKSLYSFYSD